MSEAELQSAVIEAARLLGIKVYHTHDSRRSEPGFPDLCLVGQVVEFWELKSETGKITKEQREWLSALQTAGVNTEVMRPSDWNVIERRLHRIAGR